MYYNTLSILYFRDCKMGVTIQILYCRLLAGKAVSRYKICIVTEGLGLPVFFAVIQNIVLWLGSWAGLARRARGRWALGRDTRTRSAATRQDCLRHGRLAPTIRQPVRSRYDHGGLRDARGTARRGACITCCDTATGACDTAGSLPRHGRGPGHDTAAMRAPGRASAHLGVPVGPARCSCIRLVFFFNWFSTL